MTDKIKRDGTFAALKGFHKAIPIILGALALYMSICLISGGIAAFGRWTALTLRGLFSTGAYFIPVFLAVHACLYARDLHKKSLLVRCAITLGALLMIGALAHVSAIGTVGLEPKEFFRSARLGEGGGYFGGILAYGIAKILGRAGVIIIAVIVLISYLAYFFMSSKKFFKKLALTVLTYISDTHDKKQAKRDKMLALEAEQNRKDELERQNQLLNDEFFSSANTLSRLTIPELGIQEVNTAALAAPGPEATEEKTEEKKREPERNHRALFDYGIDNSLPSPSEIKAEATDLHSSQRAGFGLDENADDVFNDRFDGFDFKINQELASKPSSRAAERVKSEPVSEIATPIYNVSPEDVEKARRRADFEMKKKAALEAREEIERITITLPDEETLEFGEPPVDNEEDEEPIEETAFLASENEDDEPAEELITDTFIYNDNEEEDESEELYEEETEEIGDYSYEEIINEEPEENEEAEMIMQREVLEDEGGFEDDEDEEDEETVPETEDGEDDGEESDSYYEEIPPEEQNPQINEYRKMFSFLDEEEENEREQEEEYLSDEDEAVPEPEDDAEEAPFEDYRIVEETPVQKPVKETKKKEESAEPKPDYSKYKFPPIDLLHVGQVEEDENSDEETKENAEKLVETLAQFSVKVSLKGYDRGPRITRYEIVPAKGVKVNQVTNLFDDIALSMAADGIRMEAPIPGKSAIGVEIPNKKPSLVFLRDLIETDDFLREESKTCAAIGKDVTGNPVFGDISKMPHVLIAGATGMGKSVCINAVLISILYKARPDEVKFIMIDPKRVEFNSYNGIPHLLIPVVTEVKQAAGALMWAVEQMEKRYDLMGALEVKKLDEYNELVRENPSLGEPLPKIIIVIDELNDIMLQARKPVEGLIMSIAQKARAAGIHLILGTQRPSVDVITGVIKSNIPSRISCKVMSFQDSKTIIDQAGAEKLLNNGDMLYFPNGSPKPLRVQGAYVSNSEVSQIMRFLKDQTKGMNIYDQKALDEINSAAKKCVKGGDDDSDDEDGQEENSGILNDQQFLDAVDLAIKSGKISTSLIQRRIGVGYGKAAKFIDYMEDFGIVSEPNGQKPRDILIDRDTWHEMLARRAMD